MSEMIFIMKNLLIMFIGKIVAKCKAIKPRKIVFI